MHDFNRMYTLCVIIGLLSDWKAEYDSNPLQLAVNFALNLKVLTAT